MSDTTRAVLLLADISGFTKFLKLHTLSTSHARQIIVRLLDALVKVSEPPLKVAELEGDAVFFYALAEERQLMSVANRVKAQLPRMFRVFKQEIEALQKVPVCVCQACTTVGSLRLKQVMHTGEVAIERIGRFEKLFGLDVIVVHRMLKNSVPASEYLMLTVPAYETIGDFYMQEPERRTETLEGVGVVETVVFYEEGLAKVVAEASSIPAPPSRAAVLGFDLRMLFRSIAELLKGKASGKVPAA
jgi:hypothetical protein